MQDRLEFDKYQLKNGITIHHQKMDVPFFYLTVFIPVGSAHSISDNPGGRNGVAHFLEHTTLQRSPLFPEKDAFDTFVASRGAYVNAFTGVFDTRFFIHGPSSAQKELLEGLVSMVYEPLFHEEDIATERGVVSNERRQRKYFPSQTELGQYINTEWLFDKPVSKEQVFGTDEDLAACTEQSLTQFQTLYAINETAVIVVGNISEQLLVSSFERIATKPSTLRSKYDPIGWTRREYHEHSFRDVDHPVYFLGGAIPHYDLALNMTLQFMGSYLINPYTGILHRWLRNDMGWTYGLYTTLDTYEDRIKWVLEVPLNDTSVVPQIRKELPGRIRAALADKQAVANEVQRLINRNVFNLQTAGDRIDAAVDALQDVHRIPTETEFLAMLESMRDTELLLKTFDSYFTPDTSGELLALPE